MLQDLKSGAVKADLVLVDTFERLSRADEGADLRRQLQRAGVLVLTADSGFADPTSTSGRALAMVESIRATEEGRIKAHNVVRGKKDAVRQRQWPGGPPPLGFRLKNVMVTNNGVEEIDHRVLEPHPGTRWVVEEMFRLAAEQGLGTARLAKHFNNLPQLAASLKPFHPATIGGILDNPIYRGELVWGKHCTGIVDDVRILQRLPGSEWERIPGFCEPLVSQDLWDRVQQLREARRGRLHAARASTTDAGTQDLGARSRGIALRYLLSGLVRCNSCQRAMIAASSKPYLTKSGEERRYVAYACPGYTAGLCDNGCRIPEPWLRETILDLVRERLFFGEA